MVTKALKNIMQNPGQTIAPELFQIANTVLQQSITEVENGANNKFIQKNKEFLRQLRYNTGVFAAFKAHDQTKSIAAKLRDEKGQLRTFGQFRKATRGITTHHNKLWLKTEYNTAVRSARMAANWKRFESTAHIYPNLEYLPSRSATPREAHRKLWGTIRPITDPFWDTHMPPSAWNCKCSVRATRKQPNAIPANAPVIPTEFRFNPGKTAQTFNTQKHPYRQNTNAENAKMVNQWHDQEYLKQVKKKNDEYRSTIHKHKGKSIPNPHTATNTFTILRRSIADIWKHSINPHVKAYISIMESDLHNWKYLGYSKTTEGKHKEASWFMYYEVQINKETYYVNTKVHKIKKAEVPYVIFKTINLDKINRGLPPDIGEMIKK